jgi:hypothetical protein
MAKKDPSVFAIRICFPFIVNPFIDPAGTSETLHIFSIPVLRAGKIKNVLIGLMYPRFVMENSATGRISWG